MATDSIKSNCSEKSIVCNALDQRMAQRHINVYIYIAQSVFECKREKNNINRASASCLKLRQLKRKSLIAVNGQRIVSSLSHFQLLFHQLKLAHDDDYFCCSVRLNRRKLANYSYEVECSHSNSEKKMVWKIGFYLLIDTTIHIELSSSDV